MGLDITHWKLLPEKTYSSEMFLKEEIELGMNDINNLNNEAFKDVLVNGMWEFVAVFDNVEDLELAKYEVSSLNDGYRNIKLLLSKTGELYHEKISHFEIENGIKEFDITQDTIEIDLEDGRKIQFESICYEGKLSCKVAYFA